MGKKLMVVRSAICRLFRGRNELSGEEKENQDECCRQKFSLHFNAGGTGKVERT